MKTDGSVPQAPAIRRPRVQISSGVVLTPHGKKYRQQVKKGTCTVSGHLKKTRQPAAAASRQLSKPFNHIAIQPFINFDSNERNIK
jgi:hypothetical protein